MRRGLIPLVGKTITCTGIYRRKGGAFPGGKFNHLVTNVCGHKNAMLCPSVWIVAGQEWDELQDGTVIKFKAYVNCYLTNLNPEGHDFGLRNPVELEVKK